MIETILSVAGIFIVEKKLIRAVGVKLCKIRNIYSKEYLQLFSAIFPLSRRMAQ